MGERNAIRRALRREAAWRRRRGVVLLKTHLEKQPLPLPESPSPNRVVGSGTGAGGEAWAGKQKRPCARGAGFHLTSATSTKAEVAAGGRGEVDGLLLLRRVIEGVVDLAAREEALFRQIIMFL